MSRDLSTTERRRLTELETKIARGLDTFFEVGSALAEIREFKLYRPTHKTFKDYCNERWGFSDSRGRQLIAAARTVTDVTARGLPAPKTEGEARRVAVEIREADRADVDAEPPQSEWHTKRNEAQKRRMIVGISTMRGTVAGLLDSLDIAKAAQACEPDELRWCVREARKIATSLNVWAGIAQEHSRDSVSRLARERPTEAEAE